MNNTKRAQLEEIKLSNLAVISKGINETSGVSSRQGKYISRLFVWFRIYK
jgi:hypothetical protein